MRTLSWAAVSTNPQNARIVESVLSGATCLATARLLKVSRGLVLRTMVQGSPLCHDPQAGQAQEASNQQEAVSPAAGLCQGHPVDRPAWLPCVLGWLQGHSLCWTYYSAKVEGRPDLLEHEGIRTLR